LFNVGRSGQPSDKRHKPNRAGTGSQASSLNLGHVLPRIKPDWYDESLAAAVAAAAAPPTAPRTLVSIHKALEDASRATAALHTSDTGTGASNFGFDASYFTASDNAASDAQVGELEGIESSFLNDLLIEFEVPFG